MNTLEKLFKTDKVAEETGVDHYVGGGVTLTIARQGNPAYQNYIGQLTKPYREEIEAKTLSDDIWEDIVVKAMAKTILVGWSGVKNDAGEDVTYSEEAAFSMMKDMPDLREVVSTFSMSMENYRVSELEDDTKN